jgi:hypothetical protein
MNQLTENELNEQAINAFLKKCNKEDIMQEHLYTAIHNDEVELVENLLKNKNVRSNHNQNTPISLSFELGLSNIVQLLWKDKMVKSTLKKDELEIFHELTKQDIKNKVSSF